MRNSDGSLKVKLEDYPEEIMVENYWRRNGVMTLREALPADHPENLWNWFRKTYPDLDPGHYGISDPKDTYHG